MNLMRLRLLSKLLLSVLVPAMAGLCVVSWLSYPEAEKSLTQQIDSTMTLVVERQRSELATTTSLLRDSLRYTADMQPVQAVLRNGDNAASPAGVAAAGALLENLVKEFDFVKEVALLNEKGTVLYHNNPKLIGSDFG